MDQVIQFVSAHYMMILGVAYAVISAGVAATKSEEDDTAWLRFCQAISILAPRNVPKVFSLPGKRDAAIVLLCFVPLLGGCAHMKQVGIAAAEDARARACIDIETRCIDRMEAGDMTVAEAELCVSVTRATCDAISERVTR
jgi:hypothetical protein